jgi:predicted metal-dependent enzyme (double-stranded beta helix superfamily)
MSNHQAPTDGRTGEFLVDSPGLHAFIAQVQDTVTRHPDDVLSVLEALRPHFAALLTDQTWLPDEYGVSCPGSGMGGGIGQWLLFRAADRSLSLFSLVVPPGSATPVHDHLAWGLVGLYRGEQEETVYRPVGAASGEHARLAVEELRRLRAGDFYSLLPPEGDIHKVKTTSDVPSVSIHLLGNDAGCVWRHAYDPDQERVRQFRSGYSNMPCDAG